MFVGTSPLWILLVLLLTVNPFPAKLIYFNFQPLKVVCRYRDPQLQVAEKYWYLFNLRPNICEYLCLNTHFILNNSGFYRPIKRIDPYPADHDYCRFYSVY